MRNPLAQPAKRTAAEIAADRADDDKVAALLPILGSMRGFKPNPAKPAGSDAAR